MEDNSRNSDWEVRERSEWKVPSILKRLLPNLSAIGLLLGVMVPFYTMQNDRFNSIESSQNATRTEILDAIERNDVSSERRMDFILKKSISNDIQILQAKSEKDRSEVENHVLKTFEREYSSL